ncbi:uncharacterized protein G2W53_037136 [Senna tora]|uniref:Retrotransposon gag domain-containing protein n=1 Tax=Senna tora TaxID=362788 RepID=A0A834W6S0_9FABA|nr:uncharacterized protein G2W53_037136 [Senna tora]
MQPVHGCKEDGVVGTPHNRTNFDSSKPYSTCRASVAPVKPPFLLVVGFLHLKFVKVFIPQRYIDNPCDLKNSATLNNVTCTSAVTGRQRTPFKTPFMHSCTDGRQPPLVTMVCVLDPVTCSNPPFAPRLRKEKPSLIDMAEEKTLKELDAPPVQQAPLCISAANPQALLELKSSLIHLLPKFRGLANEDPYNHLKEFHVVCSSMKPDRIIEDQIKLRAFPFFLEDAAKKWLFYLPAGSIMSWEQMMKIFLRESPKENEKCCKIEAAKEGVSKAAVDGDLNNHQIDPGEKSQKYLAEIDATDQFGGPTMLKAPPWCNKAKSPHHINQELPFTSGVEKNLTGRDARTWHSYKATSTLCALIDPG